MFLFHKQGLDDLVMVKNPSNSDICDQLKLRFNRNVIYTNIGDVLISLNPFKQLDIYGSDYIQLYHTSTSYDSPPHVYKLAQQAYQHLCEDGSSQAVIISGESGAGKTEAAKLLLNYISAISGERTEQAAKIKQCVHEANPVLESFGNAKTVRNDNSSRFGKYLEIQFDDSNEMSSAQTFKFLLEKSRVVYQANNERTFHIFYQLVKASTPEMREQFNITGDCQQFHYTSSSQCFDVPAIDDLKWHQELLHGMDVLEISSDERWYCFQLLAGILHCGNLQFNGDLEASIVNENDLQWAAYLFEMEPAQLERSILFRIITTGKASMYEVPNNPDQAAAMRDALCKTLYERVFDFLVTKINKAMERSVSRVTSSNRSRVQESKAPPPGHSRGIPGKKPPPKAPPKGKPPPPKPGKINRPRHHETQKSGRSPYANLGSASRALGVLDIYGFEIFENNGYEQFCINYVNERLQQIFIDLTLRQEQQEYHDENLNWADIKFFDNRVVVELIEGANPPGMFRLLDDVCRSAHAVDTAKADEKFVEKLQEHLLNNQYLAIDKQRMQFQIQHYAGEVLYTVQDFAFKNKDNLFVSLIMGLQTTQNAFLKKLFPEDVTDEKQQPPTAGKRIRDSANMLIDKLSVCVPHYVRTIKPNPDREPMSYISSLVTHQVKYLGLLENVKVKRAGFAYRHYYSNFVARFGALLDTSPTLDKRGAEQINTMLINQNTFKPANKEDAFKVTADEFFYGRSKIFVRSPETIFLMEEMLLQRLDPIKYTENVKKFKEVQKLANAHKNGLKPKCVIQ